MSNPTVQIAARTSAGIVQPIQSTADGALRVATGFPTPLYDKFVIVRVGSTNNTDYTEYRLNEVPVARIKVTYFGGTPISDNAQMSGSFLQLPPFE